VEQAQAVFAQDRALMEAAVSAANRQVDELKIENEGLRREAESREAIESLAAERLEHARLQAELRQEFRYTSDRQTAIIEEVRLDLAQSAVVTRELENHLGAARALSESLSREIDKLTSEANQLKVDLATAHTGIETSNREVREVTHALHIAEIEATRLRTALHAKEEALQVEIARRIAADNAVAELRTQLKTPARMDRNG